MINQVRRAPVILVVAVLALAAAAPGCGDDDDSPEGSSGASQSQGLMSRSDIRIEFAAVGVPGSPFYKVVKNGATQAGKDLGVDVEYKETDETDPQEQARLIEAAIARKPDGLIVTDHWPDILDVKIKEAVDAGIPTLIINAMGENTLEKTGAFGFVGQQEVDVGRQAGETMREAGVKRVLCVNHSQGSVSLEDRCRGLVSAYPPGDVKEVVIEGEDPTASRNALEAALESNPGFDGMLTLGSASGEPAIAAIAASDSDVKLGTIDLSRKVLEGVAAGNVLFASDQQQYLQGYLPVQQLALFLQYGLRPPEFTPTGPHYVTKETAEAAIELTEQGIR